MHVFLNSPQIFKRQSNNKDLPQQVQATILTKGEFQDLLERTLCNGYGDVITLKATTASYDDHLLCLPYLAWQVKDIQQNAGEQPYFGP